MVMPKALRRWKRKRDWNAFGRAGKRARELERQINDYRDCCPDYAFQLMEKLDEVNALRESLYITLTQEV